VIEEYGKMGDPKPLASLTSGLLARKGQAAPAMRRQSMMVSPPDMGTQDHHNPFEDLGWNDMGESPDHVRQPTGLSPMPTHALAPVAVETSPTVAVQSIETGPEAEPEELPFVVRQQEELLRLVAEPVEDDVKTDNEIEDVISHLPEAPVLHVPVAEVVVPVSSPIPVAHQESRARAAAGSRGKAAFTLRLDSDRHLKLRLVCAINHRSAQQIVTQALDEFLARQPSVNDLVAASGRVN
jgi:hypothetical protein